MTRKRKPDPDSASPEPVRRSSRQVRPAKVFSYDEPEEPKLERRSKRKVKDETAEEGGVSNGGDDTTPEGSVGSENGAAMTTAVNVGGLKAEAAVGEEVVRKTSRQVRPKKKVSYEEPKETELVRRSRTRVKDEKKNETAEDGGVSNGGDEATPEGSVGFEEGEDMTMAENDDELNEEDAPGENDAVKFEPPKMEPVRSRKKKSSDPEDECKFVGNPVPAAEAERRWPERYGAVAKV